MVWLCNYYNHDPVNIEYNTKLYIFMYFTVEVESFENNTIITYILVKGKSNFSTP